MFENTRRGASEVIVNEIGASLGRTARTFNQDVNIIAHQLNAGFGVSGFVA
jgi:hypothetical protein